METKHTPTPLRIVKCSCGMASCDYYGLSDGNFPQGSGWDKDTAQRHANASNAHDDLVKALEIASHHISNIRDLRIVDAALAKARGEA